MDENHQKFLGHLDESEEAVWFIAKWLHDRGECVRINTAPKAPDHQSWRNYADRGDIEIATRIEVKRRGVYFTGKDDWPYPDFLVCACHTFDNALPKPKWFFTLSHDLKAAGIVSDKTREHWLVVKIKDSRYKDFEQDCYACPLEYVQWKQF